MPFTITFIRKLHLNSRLKFKQFFKSNTIRSDKGLLEKFNMKPCRVILDRFSKIGISCSASSDDGVKLSCSLVQNNAYTISLRVKRNEYDMKGTPIAIEPASHSSVRPTGIQPLLEHH